MKKAQMEILGLAIVIVLMLVATIFVVRFLALKTPTGYRKGFVSSELASNMLNAFLKTVSEDCKQVTMGYLLMDCAHGTGLICENGDDSCKYVNETAKTIFSSTLSAWNMDHEFLAYTNINRPLIKLGKPCTGREIITSKIFPVPISTGTMYVKLDICG